MAAVTSLLALKITSVSSPWRRALPAVPRIRLSVRVAPTAMPTLISRVSVTMLRTQSAKRAAAWARSPARPPEAIRGRAHRSARSPAKASK
jgi:hypothetical protein